MRALVAGSPLDAEKAFALTDGNPYFVSELVASAVGSSVPPTVVDAVLGSCAGSNQHIRTSWSCSLLCRRPSTANSSMP